MWQVRTLEDMFHGHSDLLASAGIQADRAGRGAWGLATGSAAELFASLALLLFWLEKLGQNT